MAWVYVKMLEDAVGAPEGHTLLQYIKGAVHYVTEELADLFIRNKQAVPHPPAAPPSPVQVAPPPAPAPEPHPDPGPAPPAHQPAPEHEPPHDGGHP